MKMRRIVLAALLSAMALPAWAGNVFDQFDKLPTAGDAIKLCYAQEGAIWNICFMKHSEERWALSAAKSAIEACDKLEKEWNTVGLWLQRTVGKRSDEFQKCAAERAYIKQRWGY
jgi:hypothetical protein